MHNASELARRVDAVQHALVVRAAHLDDVVHRVGQVGRQNVDDDGLDAQCCRARSHSHGEFDILLKLWLFIVDGHKVERLAVQQA